MLHRIRCSFQILWISSICLLVASASGVQAGRGADGEYEKRTSSHFVLYQDVGIDRSHGLYGSRRFEQKILDVLEQAYRDLDALLGLRVSRRIVVTIHDPEIFDQRFAGLFRFPAAGFYGGSIHIRGATVVSVDLVKTLHHELVHGAFDTELDSMQLPAWFNEGIAEWFEWRSVGRKHLTGRELATLADLARGDRLPDLADLSGPSFGHLGPESAWLAYLQSFSFFEYLTRVDGDHRLRDLCRAVMRTGDVESAFRRTYRGDLASLEAGYRSDLLASAY